MISNSLKPTALHFAAVEHRKRPVPEQAKVPEDALKRMQDLPEAASYIALLEDYKAAANDEYERATDYLHKTDPRELHLREEDHRIAVKRGTKDELSATSKELLDFKMAARDLRKEVIPEQTGRVRALGKQLIKEAAVLNELAARLGPPPAPEVEAKPPPVRRAIEGKLADFSQVFDPDTGRLRRKIGDFPKELHAGVRAIEGVLAEAYKCRKEIDSLVRIVADHKTGTYGTFELVEKLDLATAANVKGLQLEAAISESVTACKQIFEQLVDAYNDGEPVAPPRAHIGALRDRLAGALKVEVSVAQGRRINDTSTSATLLFLDVTQAAVVGAALGYLNSARMNLTPPEGALASALAAGLGNAGASVAHKRTLAQQVLGVAVLIAVVQFVAMQIL
jgi:hypothetical protein